MCSSIARRIAGTSGSTRSASPVSTISSIPRRGWAPQTSFVSSPCTRSGVIRSSWPAIAVIAATTRGAGVKPSWETNRAARSIRSGSSANDSSGVAGVSSVPVASAASPPCGSTNRRPSPVSSTAIALRVKSRRTRSSSMVAPNATTGLRVTRS